MPPPVNGETGESVYEQFPLEVVEGHGGSGQSSTDCTGVCAALRVLGANSFIFKSERGYFQFLKLHYVSSSGRVLLKLNQKTIF